MFHNLWNTNIHKILELLILIVSCQLWLTLLEFRIGRSPAPSQSFVCGVGLSLQSFCPPLEPPAAKRISAQSLTQAPAQPPLVRTMPSESDFIAKQ
ncbi:MAG: hypothetical protein LBQ31_05675 [Bacteroidales bacterium]|nr:hypothetical protein [Bacteroidales bacterium]